MPAILKIGLLERELEISRLLAEARTASVKAEIERAERAIANAEAILTQL